MGYSYLFMAMQNPPTSQDHRGNGGYDGTTGSINQVIM